MRALLSSLLRLKESSGQLAVNSFRGVVVKGRGYATTLMEKTQLQENIGQTLGMEIVPGTLNIRLSKRFNGKLDRYVSVEELGFQPGTMPGVPDRKGLRFAEVLIAGRFRGFVFQGDEPNYPQNQVELISSHNLRETLNLADGDWVEFTLTPEATNLRPSPSLTATST